jgi:hypothetical protein
MIWGDLKDDAIVLTAEEIAINYARKYEDDAEAERLRRYFEDQRQLKNQQTIGWIVFFCSQRSSGVLLALLAAMLPRQNLPRPSGE